MRRRSFHLLEILIALALLLQAAGAEAREQPAKPAGLKIRLHDLKFPMLLPEPDAPILAALRFPRKIGFSLEAVQPSPSDVRFGPRFGLTRGQYHGEIQYHGDIRLLFSLRF